jgi:signal transduction histidine kinase
MPTSVSEEVSRNPIRLKGLTIQQRLPLLICVLLLSMIVIFCWISYQGVKIAAVKSGKERLLSLTTQLSSMFAQSIQVNAAATRTAVNQNAVRYYLKGDNTYRDSVAAIFERIRQDTATAWVVLLNPEMETIFSSSKDSIRAAGLDVSLNSRISPRITAGRLILIGNKIYFPVIVPLIDTRSTLGYVVRWRILSTSPQTIEQFSQLMGTHAKLYVGNNDGSLWTDLVQPVSHYIRDTSSLHVPMETTTRSGNKFLHLTKPIPGTAWLLSIEFPYLLILQSAKNFLRWMIIAGFIILVAGIFFAWIMSRNITRPLNKLALATAGIAQGNYIAPGMERKDEVGKLARAFNLMTGQVSEARQGLELKIAEAEEKNQKLHDLTAHLQNIREEERMHIAREMHDELGQLLTAFRMDIAWLEKRMDHADPPIKEKLKDMTRLVDDSVVFVRKLSSELRPSVLDDFGLIPALEWHSKEFEKRFHIAVSFQTNLKEVKVTAPVATGLFRMYQESLTNVARHANASSVTSELHVNDQNIELSITDNGNGFEVDRGKRKTLGLLGMQERAAMIGGKLDICSTPGSGTSVRIVIPGSYLNETKTV